MLGAYVYSLLSAVGEILSLLLIARALLSFFGTPHRSSPLYGIERFLHRITEPVLRPIRQVLPDTGFVDFSPLVAIVAIWLVLTILRSLLFL